MMKRFCLALWLTVAAMGANAQTKTYGGDNRAVVLMETTEGNIKIELLNETPKHRDNFLKLVRMHFYDSILVHRVVKDFMIQMGDPNSKYAKPGEPTGSGSLDYLIDSEFRLPDIYHRRGMVASAREGDDVNPDRKSDACHFYIVWGKVMDDRYLDVVQARIDTATNGTVKLTPEMRETYKTVGGTPHLDGQYTVWGRVVEGLDVVDRIQQHETDKLERPLTDVRILRIREL